MHLDRPMKIVEIREFVLAELSLARIRPYRWSHRINVYRSFPGGAWARNVDGGRRPH
jgi:hypothetical protein